jgi:hypothetical protein
MRDFEQHLNQFDVAAGTSSAWALGLASSSSIVEAWLRVLRVRESVDDRPRRVPHFGLPSKDS